VAPAKGPPPARFSDALGIGRTQRVNDGTWPVRASSGVPVNPALSLTAPETRDHRWLPAGLSPFQADLACYRNGAAARATSSPACRADAPGKNPARVFEGGDGTACGVFRTRTKKARPTTTSREVPAGIDYTYDAKYGFRGLPGVPFERTENDARIAAGSSRRKIILEAFGGRSSPRDRSAYLRHERSSSCLRTSRRCPRMRTSCAAPTLARPGDDGVIERCGKSKDSIAVYPEM